MLPLRQADAAGLSWCKLRRKVLRWAAISSAMALSESSVCSSNSVGTTSWPFGVALITSVAKTTQTVQP